MLWFSIIHISAPRHHFLSRLRRFSHQVGFNRTIPTNGVSDESDQWRHRLFFPTQSAMSGRACAGCSAPSKLQCPVCLKSSILALSPASYFCSQDCFKKSWADHKVLHAVAAESSAKAASTALEQAASGNYNPWPGYKFTGPLRPWPYGPVNSVPAHIKKPDYAATGACCIGACARVLTSLQVSQRARPWSAAAIASMSARKRRSRPLAALERYVGAYLYRLDR